MAESTDLMVRIIAQDLSQNAMLGLSKNLNGLKHEVLGLGAAIGSAFAIRNVIDTTNQWTRSVREVQSVTGLAAGDASRLAFAARTLGIESEELNTALGRLAKNMFSNSVEADRGNDAFSKWGIAAKDARGNVRNINDVLMDTAQRVQKLGDSEAARALELDLFGKSGGRMHELLLRGAAGVRALESASDALGFTLNGQTIDAMHEFEVKTNAMGVAFDGLKVTLVNAFLPILSDGVTTLTKWVGKTIEATRTSKEFQGIVKLVGDVIRSVLGWLKGGAELIGRIVQAIKSTPGAVEALGVAFAALLALKVATWIDGAALGLWRMLITILPLTAAVSAFVAGYEVAGAVAGDDVFGRVATGVSFAAAAFGLILIRLNPVLSIFESVIAAGIQVGLTVQLITSHWGAFVFALRSGALGDIPVFGAFFSAIKNGLELIDNIHREWDLFFALLHDSTLGDIPVIGSLFSALKNAVDVLESLRSAWDDFWAHVNGTAPPPPRGGFEPSPGGQFHGAPGGPNRGGPGSGPGLGSPGGGAPMGFAPGTGALALTNPALADLLAGATSAASGFSGIVDRPRLFLAGESGREMVSIGPMGAGGGTNNITINIGSVDSRERINELAEAVGDVLVRQTGHVRAMAY